MDAHTFTIATTPGLVATWIDATCSCGWQLTTLGGRSAALALCEQHLDDAGADGSDFDALCSL